MFCSTCKSFETTLRECSRRICPLGHIACEKCGADSAACPVCEMVFFNYVHIEFLNETPRMFITRSKSQLEEGDIELNENNDSFQEIIKEIQRYEHDGSGDEDAFISGGLEVVDGEANSAISFPFDEDEERAILKCYKICNKTSHDRQQEIEKKSRSTKEEFVKTSPSLGKSGRMHHCNHRELQTSVTYVVEELPDKTNPSLMQQSLFSSSNFLSSTRAVNPSMNNYLEEDSHDSTAVYEIFYKNQGLAEDSEVAHFTSLTVSNAGSSPAPDSPPKNGIPSIGHRVKFSSFYNLEHQIPAQMEPLAMFDIESGDSSDELASDRSRKLPRFPVQCPITNCESNSVPSDFCNHITIDHPYIDVLKVSPGRVVNIEISDKANPNMIIGQRLFLITDRITDIGYGTFENTLPIVMLTSKMSMRKVFGCSRNNNSSTDENFFIFLVGVYQFPISYTITLWSHGNDDLEPTMIKSMSDSVFFMSKPLTPKRIAVNALAVKYLELQAFTNDGKKKLSCQIMFH